MDIRKIIRHTIRKINFAITAPFVSYFQKYFLNRPFIYGNKERVHVGKRVSLVNTLLNTGSGHIYIGDDTIMGHNCSLVTGVHQFENGIRKKIYHREKYNEDVHEVPEEGNDIVIGKGCWITTNVTIIGGVTIGDNVIITAGAVVTKDIPSSVVAGGVPAKIIKQNH